MRGMSSYPTHDLALAFDGAAFAADLVIADGDLVTEDTPAAPILVSLGSDRRAAPDDVLPTGVSPLNQPTTWSERRGWWGDALDRRSRRIGSRLWLLDREKATEQVRLRAQAYVAEALAWMALDLGVTPDISVTIERAETKSPVLLIRVQVDARSVSVVRRLQ